MASRRWLPASLLPPASAAAAERVESEDLAALRAAAGRLARRSPGRLRLADATDAVVHPRTGMRFPRRIGPFVRGAATRFDADGADLGIAYERRDGADPAAAKSAHVSIFLYPVPAALAAIGSAGQAEGTDVLFARAKADLGAVVLEEKTPLDPPLLGWHARASGLAALDGTEQPVTEMLWLFAYLAGDWVLTCRATCPAGDEDAADDCAALVDSLPWPESFGG